MRITPSAPMTKPEPVPVSIPPCLPNSVLMPKKSSGDSPLFPGFTRCEASIRTICTLTNFCHRSHNKIHITCIAKQGSRPGNTLLARSFVLGGSCNFGSLALLLRVARICTKLRPVLRNHCPTWWPGSRYQQQYVNCLVASKICQ